MIKSIKNKKVSGFTPHLFTWGRANIHSSTKKGEGFTLVELLVVISIIGILSSLSTVSVNVARERARDAKRKSDAAQVQLALYLYFDDNLTFPVTDQLPENAVANWNGTLSNSLNGSILGSRLYMAQVPRDPTNFEQYVYGYNSDGRTFTMSYYLEEGGPRELVGY